MTTPKEHGITCDCRKCSDYWDKDWTKEPTVTTPTPQPVYRVIANGTHIQPMEHVRSARNGWHTYRVLQPDPMAGEEVSGRTWYPDTTPMGAVIRQLSLVASRMRIAAICLASPGTHWTNAKELRAEVEEHLKEHTALLMQVQMLAAQAGLMMPVATEADFTHKESRQ